MHLLINIADLDISENVDLKNISMWDKRITGRDPLKFVCGLYCAMILYIIEYIGYTQCD